MKEKKKTFTGILFRHFLVTEGYVYLLNRKELPKIKTDIDFYDVIDDIISLEDMVTEITGINIPQNGTKLKITVEVI